MIFSCAKSLYAKKMYLSFFIFTGQIYWSIEFGSQPTPYTYRNIGCKRINLLRNRWHVVIISFLHIKANDEEHSTTTDGIEFEIKEGKKKIGEITI